MAPTVYTETLYVVLGVEEDASTQEIKQAYKKAALRTHPDRALPEKKEEAEANFKRIAEAYEILSKPDSRRQYDMFGVPGAPAPRKKPNASNSTFNDPSHTFFGTSPDSQPFTFQWESSHDSARRAQAQRGNGNRRPFGMDPFELFNQMFASELNASRSGRSMFDEDPFHQGHQQHPFFSTHRPMMPDLFAGFGPSPPMAGGFGAPSTVQQRDPFPGFGGGGFGNPMMGSTMSSSSFGFGGSMGGGTFVSESRQTRTVNGRTETVIRKTDGQGNETVETISPEGKQVYINGVEQPNQPLLSQGSASMTSNQIPNNGSSWPF